MEEVEHKADIEGWIETRQEEAQRARDEAQRARDKAQRARDKARMPRQGVCWAGKDEQDDEISCIVEYLESMAEEFEHYYTLGNREPCRLLSNRVLLCYGLTVEAQNGLKGGKLTM